MKNIPHPKQQKPITRSAAGLRESLFDMLELLRLGEVDVQTAKTFAILSMTIIKATEMQLQFERARLENEVPANLTDMKLVPPLDQQPKLPPPPGQARLVRGSADSGSD